MRNSEESNLRCFDCRVDSKRASSYPADRDLSEPNPAHCNNNSLNILREDTVSTVATTTHIYRQAFAKRRTSNKPLLDLDLRPLIPFQVIISPYQLVHVGLARPTNSLDLARPYITHTTQYNVSIPFPRSSLTAKLLLSERRWKERRVRRHLPR